MKLESLFMSKKLIQTKILVHKQVPEKICPKPTYKKHKLFQQLVSVLGHFHNIVNNVIFKT